MEVKQWIIARWDRKAFFKGAWGAALALAVIYAVSLVVPAITYPPSRLADLIRNYTPGGLATKSIEMGVRIAHLTGLKFLEHAALKGLAIFAQLLTIVLGGLAAITIARGLAPVNKSRRGMAAALVVLAGACVLALTGGQGLGAITIFTYAAAAFIFASTATPGSIFSVSEPKVTEGETPLDALRRSRRRFLRRGAAATGGLLVAGAVAKKMTGTSKPVPIVLADERYKGPALDPAFKNIAGLTPEITPTDDFYNVDIDITKPAVDHRRWKLEIKGLVNHAFALTFHQLQNDFNVVEMASTLSCISNEVGGDLISTTVWRGVRLKDVLAKAGVNPAAIELIFHGADGYSDSIPLQKGLREDTLIAFGMNGEALRRDHGFPARMVIPEVYGMKNVKWLTSIELSDSNYEGYWQHRGWSDVATVKTQSRIDTPSPNSSVPTQSKIAGIAWAGIRGISMVEISEDSGKTWRPAVLKRELARNAWRMWATEIAAGKGTHRIKVRATDGNGITQVAYNTRTHPDGASGLDSVTVTVSS